MAGFGAAAVLIAAAAALACLAARGRRSGHSVWFGAWVVDGALFPALAALTLYVADALDRFSELANAARVLLPFFSALFVLRASIGVLKQPSSWSTHATATLVAAAFAGLWATDSFNAVFAILASVRWAYGGGHVSLLQLLEAFLGLMAALVLVLWLARAVEDLLVRRVFPEHRHAGKAVANFTRIALLVVAGLVVLPFFGIDTTLFSVLSGALALGFGLSLRHLASSVASGFVLLSERAIRVGDHVRIGATEGHVAEIAPRYTIIRSAAGNTFIPNNVVLDNQVENLSRSDRRIMLTTAIRVELERDVDLLREQIPRAVAGVSTVCLTPSPSAWVSRIDQGAVEVTIGFWTEKEQQMVLSDVNVVILEVVRQFGIRLLGQMCSCKQHDSSA
jgi:small-conductance mechanosensitive channel